MTVLTTRAFWEAALERAVKTFAQTAVATLGLDVTVNVAAQERSIWDTDWLFVLGVALLAAAISILTSIGSITLGNKDSISVGGAEVLKVKLIPEPPPPDVPEPAAPEPPPGPGVV